MRKREGQADLPQFVLREDERLPVGSLGHQTALPVADRERRMAVDDAPIPQACDARGAHFQYQVLLADGSGGDAAFASLADSSYPRRSR